MIGYYANELNLDKEFGLKLLALKRAKTLKNCLGISFTEHDVMNELPENDQVQAGDELVCYGRYKDFQKVLEGDVITPSCKISYRLKCHSYSLVPILSKS